MRVIGGTARGTRLYGAKGYNIRPIIDRVKESLFNILADRVVSAEVLDLFAGVGNLGIEALSRGAAHADFIEKHRATAASIRSNLQRTHLEDKARVIISSLPGGLTAVSMGYGLIFVDPPFRIDIRLLEEVFRRIYDKGLLLEGGLLVYRHSPRICYNPPEDIWERLEIRDYGDSIISLFSLNFTVDN